MSTQGNSCSPWFPSTRCGLPRISRKRNSNICVLARKRALSSTRTAAHTTVMSTALREQRVPSSACCRPKTQPGTTSRSFSEFRSRSFWSPARIAITSFGPVRTSKRKCTCDERCSAGSSVGAGRLAPQGKPLGDCRHRVDGCVYRSPGHERRQRCIALHRWRPGSQLRRQHLGTHLVPRCERYRLTHQRMARRVDGPQAVLHDIAHHFHCEFTAL